MTVKAEVFVRHSANCKYKSQRYYRNCHCRKWIYVSGKNQRISAKTRSWERAEQLRRQIEQQDDNKSNNADSDDTILKVVADFLAIKQMQVGKTLFKRYKHGLEDFASWCTTQYDRPLLRLSDITSPRPFEKYQLTWHGSAVTKNDRRIKLKAFWNYAMSHKLVEENHARGLTKFRETATPTMPLEPEEFQQLLAAVNRYHPYGNGGSEYQRQRVRAMLLLLRWTGLRISDAAKLERSKIDRKTNNLRLYTAKAGTPINVPLPAELVTMLFQLPNLNAKYFFWSGQSAAETPAKSWGRTMRSIAKLAGIKARAHMLRDTFAVEALKSRQLTLEQVSKILGHSSVKITEKHYLPWIPALQEQLEQGVRAMWPESILTPTTIRPTVN